ncbi:MAG: hypothetical protein CMJ78_19435 [Planctomycetaceae bacterium]|nr:hypothetical protein [Planctomycetaceae bacterium]
MTAAIGSNAVFGQDPPTENADDKKPADTSWDRLIYLPYKNLGQVIQDGTSSAILPYIEYLKMLQNQKASGAKVDAVITEAHYVARIDENLVRIAAKMEVQVMGKPWVSVPIRFGNAAVGKLEVLNQADDAGDPKVLLQGTGAGAYSLLFGETGKHSIQLELETRIRTSPDGQSFDLECPTIAVTTFELTVPEADQTVNLTPQLVSLPVDAADGETRIKANLGSTPKISALWYPKASLKPDMDLLTSVTNYSLVTIQDGLIHTDAFLNYEILRGDLNQLQIAVPLGHRILGVSSDARIKGQNIAAEEKRQVVTVDFLGDVKKAVKVEVHTERPLPDDVFSVAGVDTSDAAQGISAMDAVRESGQVIVSDGNDITVAVEEQRGLIRIDLNEVLQPYRRANSLTYKFYSQEHELKLSTKPVEPRITVNHFSQLVFREDELRLRADLQYVVERAGVFELSLKIPDDLTIDTVTGNALKEYNVDEDAKTLLVTLTEKRQGALQLQVTGHRKFDAEADETEQLVPLMEPLNVVRETGNVAIFAPDALEVITDEEKLVSAQPSPVAPSVPAAGTSLASSWHYTRRPVEIPVKTIRKPTRLTATIGTSLNHKEELIEVVSSVNFTVQYAGLDTFRIAVPADVSDSVQIRSTAPTTSAAVKQKTSADPEDGWVVWTIVMQRDVLGTQPFEVTYDLKPGAAEGDANSGQTSTLIKLPQALGLEGGESAGVGKVDVAYVEGEIAVSKDRSLAISADSDADVLETIDVRELRLLAQAGTLTFRYFKQPVELTLSATKHEIQRVVETVVSKAMVEVVIGRDQSATYRCRYRLKSSERQRLRIDLPAGKELLGLLVDNKQVNLELDNTAKSDEGWSAFFINVARTKRSEEPFAITLQFQVELDDAFEAGSGSLQLPLPKIGGSGPEVVVQHLRTAVWVPKEIALVGSGDNFDMEHYGYGFDVLEAAMIRSTYAGDYFDNWVDVSSANTLDFPIQGVTYVYSNLGGASEIELSWWNMPTYTWVLSGALILIALILGGTSWENRLSIVLLIGFLATVYGLWNPESVAQAILAAQYGLMAMLAYWLIRALFTTRGLKLASAGSSLVSVNYAVVPPPGVFDEFQEDKK